MPAGDDEVIDRFGESPGEDDQTASAGMNLFAVFAGEPAA